MDEFFILSGDNKEGPFTISQMRSMWAAGRVTGESFFWREGMAEWEKLRNIKNLLETQPPPIPAQVPQAPPVPVVQHAPGSAISCPSCRRPVSREADVCPACGHPIKNGFLGKAGASRVLNVGCLIFILILGGLFLLKILF